MMNQLLLTASILIALLWTNFSLGEDLTCLQSEVNPVPGTMNWYQKLQSLAQQSLDQRSAIVEQLKTPEQITGYQRKMKARFVELLGGFPQRTPLNSQVIGRILRKQYSIEKIIFESQPNHRVTANLYLPQGTGPFPAVLVSSGHSRTAKTADYNQRFAIGLALHGMAALAYDPIGQGERSQLLNTDGKPQHSGTTTEHTMIGAGSILVGRNTATYRVWDAMRAIDYLETRADIDSTKIGMTGCSGGGTLTSYVMALDERVVCAAPACFLTTFRRLIETIGPQDAEQNVFSQLVSGLDQPDYVLLRAPKPTLISSTTGDFFDIGGSWDNLRQAKWIYGRLGFPERVDLVEAEGGHGVQPINLAAIVQWMQRWLVGRDVSVSAMDFKQFDILPESELLCTSNGQVLALPGERSVFDLNAEVERNLAQRRNQRGTTLSREQLLAEVCRLTGMRPLDKQSKPTSNKAGKVQRDGYHIDKLVMHSDSGVPLPALTFHPPEPEESAYLYVHDAGKEADGAAGGPIEKIVKDGTVVVSVDLRGQGETGNGKGNRPIDGKTFFLAYLLGQSVVGAHAEDILAAGEWVANYQSKKPREVHLIAVGQVGVAALHAAALNPSLFTSVTLKDCPRSWSSIPGTPADSRWLNSTVHAALVNYDLPDLAKTLPDGKLRFE